MPSQQPPFGDRTAGQLAEEVSIGILAALPVETAAMYTLIDDATVYDPPDDPNKYRLGYMPSTHPAQPHRVALAYLPHDGTRYAANMCANLLRTFPGVRCVVMMGIAGGIPRPQHPGKHVRLGDVVVATTLIDYGHVRQTPDGRRLRRYDGQISNLLMRAARELQFKESIGTRPWEQWLNPHMFPKAAGFARPPEQADRLFLQGVEIPHPDRAESGHPNGGPKIHYGAVGSADVLLRDANTRDGLVAQFDDLLAVEMEGSGIAAGAAGNDVPWFMVRGIADYCETNKNDRWHRNASYTAAAYLRALLQECRPLSRMALPLVVEADQERLMGLLRQAPPTDLRGLCHAAAPHLPELPPGVLQNAERTFQYLSKLNSDADGLPPALAFVDELASRLSEDALAIDLHRWVDHQAKLMLVDQILEIRRAAGAGQKPDEARPCLVVKMEPVGIHHERYRIQSWIQDRAGPWAPRPVTATAGQITAEVALDDAEAHTAGFVDRAEQVWHASTGTAAIEFLLPHALLNLPVEWWHPTGQPPLCVDYEVAVRSLDRMLHGDRMRMWGTRWSALAAAPPATTVHWCEPGRNGGPAAWEMDLRANEEIALVVLSGSPEGSPGREELTTALRAGVPVILWNRQGSASEAIREAIGDNAYELPGRVRRLRAGAAAAGMGGGEPHAGKLVVLLWDDPGRLVQAGKGQP